MKKSIQSAVSSVFNQAGIEINGKRDWDLQVHDDRFFSRVASSENLGLGESYMDGWWDCRAIDEMIHKLLKVDSYQHQTQTNLRFIGHYLLNLFFNLQTVARSTIVAKKHYDIGNDLYKCMLDREMIYSCAFWRKAQNLDEAQRDKLELSCQKLQLQPGMRVLDIGCGWGGFAKYAAKNYGVSVVGITVSQEQKKLAEENCQGLPIEIRLQDYRHLNESFDRVVSIGMFEHVGYKNYSSYMKMVHRNLKEDGIFLLHTIGSNHSVISTDYWISKYIFPNGMLPSICQIGRSIEQLFIMEDWHNFGPHYDRTLLAWHQNFEQNWSKLQNTYGEKFRRMWTYYLLSCAGCFRARKTQLWQIVLTKKGLSDGFPREKIATAFV